MKYKKYPDYKDSGIEWLGEIPNEWIPIKIKHILIEKKKQTNSLLNSGAISFGEVVYKNDNSIPAETKANYQEVKVGEFLINPLNLNFDLKSLRTALSDINVVVSTGYIVLQSTSDTNKNYLRWILHQFDVAHMKTLGAGVRQTVNFTDIGNEYFYLPLPYEQQQIANFLDNATAKIDTLIEKQTKLIEILKEKRQVVISNTIRKGINPKVKTKDSEVEWLGEIPSHWEVKRTKFLFQIRKRIAGKDGHQVLSITQKGIKKKDIKSGAGQLSMDYSKYQFAYIGDFAMNHMDLLTGYVDITKYDGVISPDYRVFTLEDKNSNPNYYLYLYQNGYKNKIFYKYGQGSSQLGRWRLPTDQFNEFRFPCPPLEEQQQIVSYLDDKTLKIDKLMEKANKSIELLKEKRLALISAVVTGKIDVREMV